MINSANNTRILAKDVFVSNDTRVTHLSNNDLIIGSSGSGKTGGYIIPNLQNISGSVIVADTKGQLCRMLRKELQDKGYSVSVIDLVRPEVSDGYNPLMYIRCKDGVYNEQDINSLALLLAPDQDSHDKFWDNSARSYIAFLIAYCLEFYDSDSHNLVNLCSLHRKFLNKNTRSAMMSNIQRKPYTFVAKKMALLQDIINVEKTWNCIAEFATRALEVFDFAELRSIFAEDPRYNVNLEELGRHRSVLFLNISDTDRAYDKIVDLIYAQALQALCRVADSNPDGRLKCPVRIIMDDFAASARIPNFDKTISIIRSREISVSIILQSLTQLDSMYGKAAATTIINNCDHLLYLGCQDINTAEFIAYKAMCAPEDILCMSRDKVYLLTNGERARLVDKLMPYSTLKFEMTPENCEPSPEDEEDYPF